MDGMIERPVARWTVSWARSPVRRRQQLAVLGSDHVATLGGGGHELRKSIDAAAREGDVDEIDRLVDQASTVRGATVDLVPVESIRAIRFGPTMDHVELDVDWRDQPVEMLVGAGRIASQKFGRELAEALAPAATTIDIAVSASTRNRQLRRRLLAVVAATAVMAYMSATTVFVESTAPFQTRRERRREAASRLFDALPAWIPIVVGSIAVVVIVAYHLRDLRSQQPAQCVSLEAQRGGPRSLWDAA